MFYWAQISSSNPYEIFFYRPNPGLKKTGGYHLRAKEVVEMIRTYILVLILNVSLARVLEALLLHILMLKDLILKPERVLLDMLLHRLLISTFDQLSKIVVS